MKLRRDTLMPPELAQERDQEHRRERGDHEGARRVPPCLVAPGAQDVVFTAAYGHHRRVARYAAQADAGRAELRDGEGRVQRIGATERLQRGEPRRGTDADVGPFAADERDAVAAQQLDATARAEIEGLVESGE